MPPIRLRCCTLLILLVSGLCTARAAAPMAIYDIRVGDAAAGIGSVSWAVSDSSRMASASTELPGALVQHDRLWLDTQGWPLRYRLGANVQGHSIQIDVKRIRSELVETVTLGR